MCLFNEVNFSGPLRCARFLACLFVLSVAAVAGGVIANSIMMCQPEVKIDCGCNSCECCRSGDCCCNTGRCCFGIECTCDDGCECCVIAECYCK